MNHAYSDTCSCPECTTIRAQAAPYVAQLATDPHAEAVVDVVSKASDCPCCGVPIPPLPIAERDALRERMTRAARTASRAAKFERIKPRAHRIEVDRCFDCPFANGVSSSCVHPAVTERTVGRALSDSFSDASLFGHYNTGTPDWCPLRDAVTMIAGPSRLKPQPTEDQ